VVVRDLRASERMPGVERIWMPGEQSHEKRIANQRNGIPLPVQLKASLDKTAAELGIAPL
jgi:LDH2 family malate/lactate/ureidoglycolate dehydrogenase